MIQIPVPLILTSDFPSSSNGAVLTRILRTNENPHVAWVPPLTAVGNAKFADAQERFKSLGISKLEFCDIDQEPNDAQLGGLDQYDVLYFTGGDPLVFRQNIQRSGVSIGIRNCLAAGRLIVAASGGAMQFTTNVSLYRLLTQSVEKVAADHSAYAALGLVEYELLPHLNTLDEEFLVKVRRYSEVVSSDIVALEDGAAMIHENDGSVSCIGRGVRFRGGREVAVEL